MRAAFIAFGTVGDVLPCLALAARFQASAPLPATVTFVTHTAHQVTTFASMFGVVSLCYLLSAAACMRACHHACGHSGGQGWHTGAFDGLQPMSPFPSCLLPSSFCPMPFAPCPLSATQCFVPVTLIPLFHALRFSLLRCCRSWWPSLPGGAACSCGWCPLSPPGSGRAAAAARSRSGRTSASSLGVATLAGAIP